MLENTIILLVEDNDNHFQLIKENLLQTYIDRNIIRFNNGRDVLDYLFRKNAEEYVPGTKRYILLLDISVSQVDGLEILKEIKQDRQMKKIPVIILTETDDPDTVEQCYHLGCSTYIVKPKEDQVFEEIIQKICQFLSVVEVAYI